MTDQPTLNVDLALRVLQYVREHPEQHDQDRYAQPGPDLLVDEWYYEPPPLELTETVQPVEGHYACMTSACIAGWAVLLSGPEVVDAAYDGLDYDGRADLWFGLGQKLLGLSRVQAVDIFLDLDDESAIYGLEALVTEATRTTE